MLFEVLSASNTLPQQLKLLDDYQTVPSVQQIVYLEQARASLLSWTRDDPFWPREMIEGLEAELRLPSLGLSLPLSEIYEGLDFG